MTVDPVAFTTAAALSVGGGLVGYPTVLAASGGVVLVGSGITARDAVNGVFTLCTPPRRSVSRRIDKDGADESISKSG